MKHTVLVAEDEQGIRDAIGIYLKNQGYDVVMAANGKQGLEQIARNEIHLAIVDIMMPEMDGIQMVMELRKTHDFPVLFLSARSEDEDKIQGLMIGADDYVTKPFKFMELMARVRSLLRRYEQILELRAQGSQKENDGILRFKGLEMDPLSKALKVDGNEVHLTPKEFSILELFMQHPGQVFSAQQIYETIWKEEAITTETITVHIRKLREKIEQNPRHPEYIQVVWGVGYRLRKEA